MSRNVHSLSILILSEDSANDSYETIISVAKKMIQIIVNDVQTQLVEFEPLGKDAARAVHGNLWKSKSPRDHQKLVDLRGSIATKLVEGGSNVPGFVFFHFDGDRPWAERDQSENVARFASFADQYIRPLVEAALKRKGIEHELEGRMKRLRPLTPFYSIEAWLYQNTSEARRICGENCGRHLDKIRGWEDDRGQLDEVVKPKSKEFCCLGSENNRALAEHVFPAEEAFHAGKSFEAAVFSLLESEVLTAALKRTNLQTS